MYRLVLFHNMNEVTIYIVVTTFFLLYVTLRKNPFSVAVSFFQELFTTTKILLHIAALLAILVFNKIELMIEKCMLPRPDFTPAIYKLEGNVVASIQHLFQNNLLTTLSTFFYVVVFPCLMIVSVGIYTYQKNYKLFYSICYALMINYMIAIPFYLFFPVFEVWAFHPHVELLMNQVFPNFESEYRALSGLDNCLPSLHTSISVTMAVIASRSGHLLWRRFTLFSAVFIIFSIFYLGVHWVADMVAGILLGLLASTVALRLSEGKLVGFWQTELLKGREIGK